MKTEFISFFVDVAQQKLVLKYSIVKMILHTLPHVKMNWKEFKHDTQAFSIHEVMERYPGIETRECLFITFIEHGYLTDEEMKKIVDLHKVLDLKNLNREYAYTEEELKYYLRSRLINRMISNINNTELPVDGTPSEKNHFQIPESAQ